MYKVTYSIGRVNRYINLKFSIILRSSKGIDSLRKENFNGNQYLFLNGLYPSLTIELIDEVRDMNARTWSTGRLVSFNKFQANIFVEYGKSLMNKFTKLKDLFGYDDKKLIVNKDLAWENREVIQTDYGKTIMLLPAVVRDTDSSVEYEGVSFMINELSNYALLTYEEFKSMLFYIERLDFDSLAIQLVNTALLMRSNKELTTQRVVTREGSQDEQELTTETTEKEKEEQPNVETTQWRAINTSSLIPEI